MLKKYKIGRWLTIAFLLVFIYYGYKNHNIFETLKTISIWAIIAIAVLKMLVNWINGLFTKWTVEAFTKKLRLSEAVYVAILSAIGNFFGPLLGGTSIRAVHFKKTHGLSYSKFTSTLAGYYLIIFMTNSLLAIIAVFLLKDSPKSTPLLIFFSLFFLFLLSLTIIKLPNKDRFNKIMAKNKLFKNIVTIIYEIEDGWQILVKNKQLMVKLFFLGFSGFVITFLLTLIEFNAIHAHISVPALILYTSFVTLSVLISLTPAAIGIREAMLIIISTTLGVSNKDIILVAIIDRGINFLTLFILFGIIRIPSVRKKIVPADAPL